MPTLRPFRGGFDYDQLEAGLADKVRSIAARIRHSGKRTLDDVIADGLNLHTVKRVLRGHFGAWLRAEFGWSERLAQHYLTVAEWLSGKSAIIAKLQIQPTALYLLAAPSVPDPARDEAIEPLAGERITTAIAKNIIALVRIDLGLKVMPASPARLRGRLVMVLEKCAQQWRSKEFDVLAAKLLDHVDSVATAEANAEGVIP